MADQIDDPVEARIRDYLAGELRQAELDYPHLRRRRPSATRRPSAGLLAAGLILVLAVLVLPPVLAGMGPWSGNGGVLIDIRPTSRPAVPPTPAVATATTAPRLTPLPTPTSWCSPVVTRGPAGFQPDDATIVDTVVDAYEQYLAAGRWADAWSCVSDFSRTATTLAAWSQSMKARNHQGGAASTIDPPSQDWTILHYGYTGAIEADVRATADVSRSYAVWVHHPGMAAVSAGAEGFIVAPLRDGTGWRIGWVH